MSQCPFCGRQHGTACSGFTTPMPVPVYYTPLPMPMDIVTAEDSLLSEDEQLVALRVQGYGNADAAFLLGKLRTARQKLAKRQDELSYFETLASILTRERDAALKVLAEKEAKWKDA